MLLYDQTHLPSHAFLFPVLHHTSLSRAHLASDLFFWFSIETLKRVLTALDGIKAALEAAFQLPEGDGSDGYGFNGHDSTGFLEELQKMDGSWKMSDSEKRRSDIHAKEIRTSGRAQKTVGIVGKDGIRFTEKRKLPLEATCHIRSIHDVNMQRQTFSCAYSVYVKIAEPQQYRMEGQAKTLDKLPCKYSHIKAG